MRFTHTRPARFAALMLAALSLSACGGGTQARPEGTLTPPSLVKLQLPEGRNVEPTYPLSTAQDRDIIPAEEAQSVTDEQLPVHAAASTTDADSSEPSAGDEETVELAEDNPVTVSEMPSEEPEIQEP
jgi:hypothetical protein